jgi:hypothetical protein
MNDSARRMGSRERTEQDGIDEQELKRRYNERLTDWSEPGAVKVWRGGNLLRPLAELRKWKPQIPWATPTSLARQQASQHTYNTLARIDRFSDWDGWLGGLDGEDWLAPPPVSVVV